MKTYLIGAALVFLAILLTGCATNPEPVVQTKVIYEQPPAILYPDCSPPEHDIASNGDLVRAYRDLKQKLTHCHFGVQQIRNWHSD
jgi:hypothetical protein